MQRIFLSGFALLAFAAAAQAQNSSTLNQIGNSQSATITQTGSNNNSSVRQITGTGTGANTGNVVEVLQNATSTLPTTNQVLIDQINGADYNKAVVQQTISSGNSATIVQAGGNGFRSGGTSLNTGTWGSPSAADAGNYAFIGQTGAGNNQTSIVQRAGVDGKSQANYAKIQQTGSNNLITAIEQSNNSVGNSALIEQGATNGGATRDNAVVLQNDNSQQNKAKVTQEGADKVAEVRQTTTSSLNSALIKQFGVDGIANIYQIDNANNNEATIDQKSTSSGLNTANIFQTQNSAYNQATIEQAGTGGTGAALINQFDQSKNNVATIQQGASGINNVAAITQTYSNDGASTSYGTGSTATIQQNLTTSSTTGNLAEIQQGFNGGTSPLPGGGSVVSNKNQASLVQENDLNVTNLLQGGTENEVTATQTGYSTIKGIDSGMTINPTAQQIGNNNKLIVNQAGSMTVSNLANIFQTGSFNSSTISQAAQ
jgi:hypothetical protein